MLDISLLGTGGMMPLPRRWVTSCIMRYNGESAGFIILSTDDGISYKSVLCVPADPGHTQYIISQVVRFCNIKMQSFGILSQH